MCDFRFDHAPFGLDAGQIRRRIRQSQFGGAAGTFGIFGARREGRAHRLVLGQRFLVRCQFLVEPRQRLGGIARQAVRLAAILFEACRLAVQIGEALFGGFELVGECRHPMAMRARIVAPVGQFLARGRQLFGGKTLCLLRRVAIGLRGLNSRFGALRGPFRLGRRARGIAPAHEYQTRFGGADLFGQFAVALGLSRLALQ